MASVSPKTVEIKKPTGAKTVLSPSNGNPEKTLQKSVLLKSPSKTSLKTPASTTKAITESSGKTNGLTPKKMDSNSPPKVARSPSAKSITPPKCAKTTPSKSTLTRNNSQGDGIVAPGKNETLSEAGDRPLNGNHDVAANVDAKTSDSDSKSSKDTSSKNDMIESAVQNGSAAKQDVKIILDSPLNKDAFKGDSTCIKEQRISSTVRNSASGDKVDDKQKTESKENSTSSERKDIPKDGSYDTNAKIQVECGTAEVEKASPNAKTCAKTPEKDQLLKEMRVAEKATVVTQKSDANASVLDTSKESSNASATGCSECSAETSNLQPEVTKHSLRLEIWEHLDKNDLVVFPRPCKGRIPNFKGAPAAAEKLASLEMFKNSKTIKINPDKPQEMVRLHTLEYGKRLLVPIPRLREGLFQAVIPPGEATKYQLQQASQRYGMKKWSKPVSLEDKVSIDLIVLGSVLVDKKGHRIGKGEGFADLEFAMLVKMNAVNENTVIATTVHDDQVRDELPEHLFNEHDVPVDWIITPTQVIEVEKKLERPKGIIWEILSNRRILEIPILQKLREKELSEGHECTLKEIDSDVEEKPFVQRFSRRRRFNNYSRSTGDPLRDSKMQPPTHYHPRQPRYFAVPQQQRLYNAYPSRRNDIPVTKRVYYRDEYEPKQHMNRPMMEPRENNMNDRQRNRPRSMNRPRSANRQDNMNRSRSMNRAVNGTQYPPNRQHSGNRIPLNNNSRMKSVEVQTVDKNATRSSRPFVKRKRPPIEFSLRVKNIGSGVRVRDLKIALNEKGIKPRDITWRGYKGFAFLHFVKSASKENSEPLNVDDVIQNLQSLSLQPKEKKSLVIEPMKRKNSEENESELKSEAISTSQSLAAAEV